MCGVLMDQLHSPVVLCSQCLVKVMSDRCLHFRHSGNEVKNSTEGNIQMPWSLCTMNTSSRGLQILQRGVLRRKWLYTDSLRESQHVCGCSKPCFQKRFGKRWMSMCFLKRNIRMHIVLGDHYYRSFRFAVISASIIT